MLRTDTILVLIVACGLSSMVASKEPFRSHITGGYKNSQLKYDITDVDCSQFSSDYDILRQFPFPIIINPNDDQWKQTLAVMKDNDTFVQHLFIVNESIIPPSIFCLSNLEGIVSQRTPLVNDIVPDALTNLKHLRELWIIDTVIVNITERLGTCTNLTQLMFFNCSLTYLPNISAFHKLEFLSLSRNRFTHLDGLPDVDSLRLAHNLFTQMPTIKRKETLRFLDMSNNPLESMVPIDSFVNLMELTLNDLALTFIPATIDKLQKLRAVYLRGNKLSYLPTNILNLPNLEVLDISNNSFSSKDIQSIQKAFSKSRPSTELFV
jgi:Leucine-rich repeat (LRR) protein